MRAMRSPLLQLVAVGLFAALYHVATGIGRDPKELIRDAIVTFCVHVFGAVAIAAIVLGGIRLYWRLTGSASQREQDDAQASSPQEIR
jgi:hypothetical protein